MKYEARIGEQVYTVEVSPDGKVLLDGQAVEIDFGAIGDSGLYSLLVNNESFEALVEQDEHTWRVLILGILYDVQVMDERTQLLRSRSLSLVPETGEVPIKAPMPGLVISVLVKVGQMVEPGQNLLILESMKMENELKAPRAGRVERIHVAEGDSVEQHQTLIIIV